MAALVAGVEEYGDLMRLAIASPGNDFRLGAMEASQTATERWKEYGGMLPRTEFRHLEFPAIQRLRPYSTLGSI